ncbi:hypothetical protein [Mesorhizobium sp. L-8-3]|uniref:hypothetical protein n=1 Tax=Mesorhizobium sp. L-8-3 TaxID=2744522 RepID=UPI001929074B|nr:hypothetical protein [Mesorhizobium sp. L-8-3]BCH23735.1 hypothetical protein MesoLjLb_35200 [Mesorhizobium sp. L-8-3]
MKEQFYIGLFRVIGALMIVFWFGVPASAEEKTTPIAPQYDPTQYGQIVRMLPLQIQIPIIEMTPIKGGAVALAVTCSAQCTSGQKVLQCSASGASANCMSTGTMATCADGTNTTTCDCNAGSCTTR